MSATSRATRERRLVSSSSPPARGAQRTLEAYRPLFTELAVSLARPPAGELDDADGSGAPADPMMAMMAGLSQMMAPAMMGMSIGSMVGRLGLRAFGQYDLPIPRTSSTLLVVPRTVDQFADEWSLPVDEMRLWVLAQELIGHNRVCTRRHARCDHVARPASRRCVPWPTRPASRTSWPISISTVATR